MVCRFTPSSSNTLSTPGAVARARAARSGGTAAGSRYMSTPSNTHRVGRSGRNVLDRCRAQHQHAHATVVVADGAVADGVLVLVSPSPVSDGRVQRCVISP